MIDAEIRNKIPKLETWEDILTSNVFGLLELIDYSCLLDILKQAQTFSNKTLEKEFMGKSIQSLELWKRFSDNSEPDIFVTMDDGTSFVIEVKYYSGEHSKKEKADSESKIYIEKGQLKKYIEITKTDYIIYLTASYTSLKELSVDSQEYLEKIYHLHWKDFNKYLKKYGTQSTEKYEQNVIDKVITYLDFKGFEHWNGFRSGYKNCSGNIDYADIDTKIGRFYEKS